MTWISNHSTSELFWTIRIPNKFAIQIPTVISWCRWSPTFPYWLQEQNSNQLNTIHPKSEHVTFRALFVQFSNGLIKWLERPFELMTFLTKTHFCLVFTRWLFENQTIWQLDMFVPFWYRDISIKGFLSLSKNIGAASFCYPFIQKVSISF